VVGDDGENSVIGFLRRGADGERPVLVVVNATPVGREGYRVGVPRDGVWRVLLDSDDPRYGGSGMVAESAVVAGERGWHGQPHSLELTLPPLGVLVLAPEAP
jgi:1,4-alpha-glucan branching enzyme